MTDPKPSNVPEPAKDPKQKPGTPDTFRPSPDQGLPPAKPAEPARPDQGLPPAKPGRTPKPGDPDYDISKDRRNPVDPDYGVEQPAEPKAVRVELVSPLGPVVPPNKAAPDGSDPSQYPRDGTFLEGLMGRSAATEVYASPSAEILNGNPPRYDAENKTDLVEEPAPSPGRLPLQCKMDDLTEGETVYKLGVSHPPYLVESSGKGFATLRAGTGGTVQVTNDSEASFFTKEQVRQYAVADGTPNASGDVRHP
jgi:hypothetical protein